jgi:hypothetical protein
MLRKAVQHFFLISPRRKKQNIIIGFGLYDKPLLASYSRSGLNLLRYAIEFISNQRTPGQKRLCRQGDYIVDRAHQAAPIMGRHPKVLLLLRDYRECLLRQHPKAWRRMGDVFQFLQNKSLEQPPEWYVDNLQAFDRFAGPKLVIYYEDLIAQPDAEICKITEFLGLDQKRAAELIKDYEKHKKSALQNYLEGGHQSVTARLSDVGFHAATHLNAGQRREFDRFYQTHYPDLFNKYLCRYQVGETGE